MNKTIQTAWIIDDDEIYKYGFRKLVTTKKLCANVFDFHNGDEAMRFLKNPNNQEHLPEIIFLDIEMPVMDGWQFVNAFSKEKAQLSKEIKIFMVTSSINYLDIIKLGHYPEITEYIIKPTDYQQFSSAFNVLNNPPRNSNIDLSDITIH